MDVPKTQGTEGGHRQGQAMCPRGGTGCGVQRACVNLSSHTSQLCGAGEAPRFSESQFFSSVKWAQGPEEEVGVPGSWETPVKCMLNLKLAGRAEGAEEEAEGGRA